MSYTEALDPAIAHPIGGDPVGFDGPVAPVDPVADLVNLVVDRALACAEAVAASEPTTRAGWMHAVAEAIDAHLEDLMVTAQAETHLGLDRLRVQVLEELDGAAAVGRLEHRRSPG